jgi:hypothetical protein
MSIASGVAGTVGVAGRLLGHPVVQVAIMAAPLLMTPQVKAVAREAALESAYRAGLLARRLIKGAGREVPLR